MVGSSSSLSIQLTNPNKTYHPGEAVEGYFIIQNDKPLTVKRVTVILEGKANVDWTNKSAWSGKYARIGYRAPHYTAKEIYISESLHLDGGGDGSNSFTLKEGSISYPFSFQLTKNLPSTFSSEGGGVSYHVTGQLERPTLKLDITTKISFDVFGAFDLNLEPRASQPQEIQKVKGSNIFLARKGQIRFILRLPHKSGFVPGEILDFQVEISNRSNKRITKTQASLVQRSTFHAQGRRNHLESIINGVKGRGFGRGEHDLWTPNTLIIPALIPPTRLGGVCHIIDVQYLLRLELKIEEFSSSLIGELPVWIGTVPVRFNKEESASTSAHLE